ncbi:MAG TPA: hypothetical protein VGV17_05680 [Bosea sp. (in: a-proteobacteria)]|uniref:hypothetical protein n=1 Tax=Bosea sp. (in: a-proteobacteria) TaxID=1871050 RepID=UPI002DDD5B5A|nr:hypothetical protein [Bosea sp. (in: a-proteobacteria)]HEV2553230.1 hypothetical protein [Bosea sp. (in: a-proteobacteria)]
MRDPVRHEVEASGMSWEEFKKLPVEPWQHWIGGLFLGVLAIVVGGPSVYRLLVAEIAGVAVYAGVGVGLACVGLGAVMYWVRDVRKWRSVMVLQVMVGATAGVVAFFATNDFWARGIALLAAVVTVADALEKLRKASHPPESAA